MAEDAAAVADDSKQTSRSAEPICRICFEGSETAELVAPCACRGTQGFVHEQCLHRWRRLQTLQGKSSKAAHCEICGKAYSASLETPGKPWMAVLDFMSVLLTTVQGLAVYTCYSRSWALIVLVTTSLGFTTGAKVVFVLTLVLVLFVLMLYSRGLRLSLLGSPHRVFLGLTAFGPPVEGLSAGMLLVSIGAGGPFHKTVLYVLEHQDEGSLAVILNTLSDGSGVSPCSGDFSVSIRLGGPIETQQDMCIHNIQDFPGAERLLRPEPVFLSRTPIAQLKSMWLKRREQSPGDAKVVAIRGISSWGEHQLDGEIRAASWGWIRPEHVKSEDVLEMDEEKLSGLWDRLINSPNLQIAPG